MRIIIILILLIPCLAFSQFQLQVELLKSETKGFSIDESLLDFGSQTDFKERKPGIAFLWSFLVPGAGQVYNRQYAKGGILFGSTVIGLIILNHNISPESGPQTGRYNRAQEGAPVGLAIALASSLYSMIDAPIVANKLNEQNGISFNLKPDLKLTPTGIGQKYALTAGPKLTISF